MVLDIVYALLSVEREGQRHVIERRFGESQSLARIANGKFQLAVEEEAARTIANSEVARELTTTHGADYAVLIDQSDGLGAYSRHSTHAEHRSWYGNGGEHRNRAIEADDNPVFCPPKQHGPVDDTRRLRRESLAQAVQLQTNREARVDLC